MRGGVTDVPNPDDVLERNIALLREYLSEPEAREAEAVLRRKHAERLSGASRHRDR